MGRCGVLNSLGLPNPARSPVVSAYGVGRVSSLKTRLGDPSRSQTCQLSGVVGTSGVSIGAVVVLVALCAMLEPIQAQDRQISAQAFTSPQIVDQTLSFARVSTEDHLVDIGSGDGRVVVAAAKRGARATGIEIDELLVKTARQSVENEPWANSVSFFNEDFVEANYEEATVIFLNLSRTALGEFQAIVWPKLGNGVRVVSVNKELNALVAADFRVFRDESGVEHAVFLYRKE